MATTVKERIATQKERLKERLKKLEAAERLAAAKERKVLRQRTRQEETRRKILAGAILIAQVERGRFPKAELSVWLGEHLKSDDDRALFADLLRPAS